MNIRLIFRISFLILSMQLLSAYNIRCWFFCTEQTAIQDEYTDARDFCRSYSQLRFETETATSSDDKGRTAKMIALFSECMSEKGWSVPDGKPAGGPGSPPAAAAAAPAPAAKSETELSAKMAAEEAKREKRRQQAFLLRSSECAFARHGAQYSSVSAARATACDIECAEKRKLSPQSPRPAACPAE